MGYFLDYYRVIGTIIHRESKNIELLIKFTERYSADDVMKTVGLDPCSCREPFYP